ncbi:hypothetical protein HanPI659440_Chr15g0607521 [Helianthus annuus]|nr:hypothetical protein HanPI659440_Chr15g0607521 [Helianthus annuus]
MGDEPKRMGLGCGDDEPKGAVLLVQAGGRWAWDEPHTLQPYSICCSPDSTCECQSIIPKWCLKGLRYCNGGSI